MSKKTYFEISGTVEVPGTPELDEFVDQFAELIESKGWHAACGMNLAASQEPWKEIEEGNEQENEKSK